MAFAEKISTMGKYLFILIIFNLSMAQKNQAFLTVFEKGNGNQSATYSETIDYYKALSKQFSTISMEDSGMTDSGFPLNVVVYESSKISKNAITILLNNGIHAGEPDGIDATMMLFRDLAMGKIDVPNHVKVVTIPVYNIGGALNRNSTSRVNQDGPEQYGFRGNARNFDLNRDFIKADTRNTLGFYEIFHKYDPAIFIDNHVSNGADYQYTLTYIQTQQDKLGKPLGEYLDKKMMPEFVAAMKAKKIDMTPYVNVWRDTPDKGFQQFFESPRYATGYAALFNTIGFVVETHMLKKYADRVAVTYSFMEEMIAYANSNSAEIKSKQQQNLQQFLDAKSYAVQWKIDSLKVDKIHFLGYEGIRKKSDVTTGDRLFYDRNKPYDKEIDYYKTYKSTKFVDVPKAYLIPKGKWKVIDLLEANNIILTLIKEEQLIDVEAYHIEKYHTAKQPYEGHYPHYGTTVSKSNIKIQAQIGDYLVETNQPGIRYLLETLEPEATDSFFNWNYFDTILQQKEGFSDYVFEDLAAKFLLENPKIKQQLLDEMKKDSTLERSPENQLDWVYKHSPYYESAYLAYPIYRIFK